MAKIAEIVEDGKLVVCYEDDFIEIEQGIDRLLRIMSEYPFPTAFQHLEIAKQIVADCRREVFDENRKPSIYQLIAS